jgi:hypothetical protein
VIALLVWVLIAVTIGADAARRGDSTVPWTLVAFILGPIGWALYLLFRRPSVIR